MGELTTFPGTLTSGAEHLRELADEIDAGTVNAIAMVALSDKGEDVLAIEYVTFYDGISLLAVIGATDMLKLRLMDYE